MNKRSTYKKLFKKSITPVFYISVFVFFVYYFRDIEISRIKETDISSVHLVVATFLLVIARFWLSFTWGRILKFLGVSKFAFSEQNYVYAKSWLGRYIPGKVVWVLGKIHFASEHGISKRKIAISSVLEIGAQLFTAILVSSLFLLYSNNLSLAIEIRWILAATAITFILVLSPPILSWMLILIAKLFGKEWAELGDYNFRALLSMVGYFAVFCCISGSAFYVLVSAFISLPIANVGYMVAAQNISGVVGMLVMLAPSGIGAREGVQLLFLQPLMISETLVILLIVSRLIDILADLLFFFFSYILKAWSEGA